MGKPVILASLAKNKREQLRIALDEWQGVHLIDLRVTTELSDATGIQVPTKKGLSLRVEMLGDVIAALRDAEVKARELKWIGGDECRG